MKTNLTQPTFARTISYFTIMAILLVACTGCSSKEENYTLRLAAAAPFVDDAKAKEYAQQLQLSGEENKISMYTANVPTPKEVGDEADPEGAAAEMNGSANAMKITAMIASEELDVFLCDVQTAGRFVQSGSFYSIEELFTGDELSGIAPERLLSYPKLDTENNPTEEILPACGIDISGNEAVNGFISSEQIGVFVAANATNLDLSKELVLQLIAE